MTTATKTRYTVTSPITGVVHTRTSANPRYTHAVVETMRNSDGTMWETVRYCGSRALAETALQSGWKLRWLNNIIDINIITLTQEQ